MKIHLQLQSVYFMCRSSSDFKDALSVELGEFRTSAMNSLGNSEYNLQNAVTSTFSHFSNNFFTQFHQFSVEFSFNQRQLIEIQFLLGLCTFRVNRQEIHLFGSDDVHYILSNIEFPCVQCPLSTPSIHFPPYILECTNSTDLFILPIYLATFKVYSA